jgi:predicted nucleotidyltransferase
MRLRGRSREEAFERYLDALRGEEVTLILFGSRARGEETDLSDYDLLVVKGRGCTSSAYRDFDPNLNISIFEVWLDELESAAHWNSGLGGIIRGARGLGQSWDSVGAEEAKGEADGKGSIHL